MATYKATMDVYLSGEGRFINAGNTFSSDCIPGSTWEPLDDDAKAAVAERDGVRDPDSASASDAATEPAPAARRGRKNTATEPAPAADGDATKTGAAPDADPVT